MRALRLVCVGLLLAGLAAGAEARRVTLKCARGYSVNITFKVWYATDPRTSVEVTMSCPPTQTATVPDGYDKISVDPGAGTMTAPDGTQTDLQLPSPVDNSPPGSAFGMAPWPPHGGYHSYIGSSHHWEVDPQAPPFIQDGELLLGEFEDGDTFPLTVRVLARGGSPVGGATVRALVAGGSTAATGTTGSDGRTTLTLAAGGEYQVDVAAVGFAPQLSDEFMILGSHMWTMILNPGPAATGWNAWTLGLALLSLLLLLLLWLARRSRAP